MPVASHKLVGCYVEQTESITHHNNQAPNSSLMCKNPSVVNEAAHGEPELEQQQVVEKSFEDDDTETTNCSFDESCSSSSGSHHLCMLPHAWGRSVSQKRYSRWQTLHMQQAWGVHFFVSLLVLIYGSMDNDGRKYISVDPSNVPGECVRAFVDVLAGSNEDEDALVCCSADSISNGLWGICDKTPNYLIFASRLSQFPEAWLLPIGPLLLRGLIRFIQYMNGNLPVGESTLSSIPSFSTTVRRLTLYLSVLLARGVILYSFFNFIEHLIVATPSSDEPCWYQNFLKNFQTPCTGKQFDFSDHVVLYFAQLLPVALSETMYCLQVPFWKKENKIMPAVLVGCLGYLYFITFLGAYKTTAYFHTPAEIFTGFAVSLLVQIPLCLLQCSPKWKRVRSYFYGQPSAGYNTILIQAR